jgi:hypothetical protein
VPPSCSIDNQLVERIRPCQLVQICVGYEADLKRLLLLTSPKARQNTRQLVPGQPLGLGLRQLPWYFRPVLSFALMARP